MQIKAGQSVLLSTETSGVCLQLSVQNGFARISDSELTLGFVGPGDPQIARIPVGCAGCLEALTDVSISWRPLAGRCQSGDDLISDWMADLLRLRAYGDAERRLRSLFQVLLASYGCRVAQGYWLPFLMSHQRLAELIGSTRSSVTRVVVGMRQRSELIDPSVLSNQSVLGTASVAGESSVLAKRSPLTGSDQPGLLFTAEFLES